MFLLNTLLKYFELFQLTHNQQHIKNIQRIGIQTIAGEDGK